MKSKNQDNHHASNAPSQYQQRTDTNRQKFYEVTLIRTQESAGVILVTAMSRQQAIQKASQCAFEISSWEPFAESYTVETVEHLKEAGNHE